MAHLPFFPEQASSHAKDVDAVFLAGMGILAFFTALILILIVTFLVRYRRGTTAERDNAPNTSLRIELLWIGIPLIISIGMFAWSAVVYYRLYSPPADAYLVDVVAKQWMFYLQHPEGKREINELHVPLGRPLRLRMISQDVIHSFYVPAFRAKQDVLPGRYTSLWFQPTRVGQYHLFCAEYCGTNHAVMRGTVEVMEPADYERWLGSGSSEGSLARQGEQLFQKHHCGGCHGPSQNVPAPPLQGVYGGRVPVTREGDPSTNFITADDRYIHDSVRLPKKEIVAGFEPMMPTYDQTELSEADLLKLIAYIKSIGAEETSK